MITTHGKIRRLARATPWVIGALCAWLPFASHALGLGKLKVHSALNQPLKAEIEFTSLTDAELKALRIGLASRTDFSAAGIDRPAHLAQIKFDVQRRADGRYVLQLSTPSAFEEPFLHMLLQLDWTGGRLVREYTALIDPPFQVAAKAPAVEPPHSVAPVEMPAPGPAPSPMPPVEVTRAAPADDLPYGPPGTPGERLSPDGWPAEPGEVLAPAAPKTAARGRIGPAPDWANAASHAVKRGETLWSITKKVRRDTQISIEQAAMAIYSQNRDAFYDGNLNNIRAGKILRMPEREAVEALPKDKALAAFQAQFDAWQEYKRRLASAKRTVAVEETAAAEGAPADKKPAADAAAKKEAPAVAKGQRSDELLKIVRANLQGEKGAGTATAGVPAKGGEPEQDALAERAATLEESLVSKQIEQKELGEKINQVRAQLKREARLIELESQALAPAPDKAVAKPAEPAKTEASKPAEAPAPAPAKVEPPKVEPPKVEAPAPPAAKKPLPPPPPPPAPEKGLFATLLDAFGDLMLPVMLAVVVLASALIGFVYLHRRRRATAEFEESILASRAVTTENMPTREAAGEAGASAAESSILSDISQGNLANVRTDEVDPVAEAEVYLAYGRDETAEEILKDAVVKHPQRHELKLKLLEIYGARKDVKAFETMAEELYAAVGGQGGKLWEKVEELGRKVSPNNPMFRGAGAPKAAAEPEAPAAVAPTVVAKTEVAPPPAALAPETALDFDLGTSEVTKAPESEKPKEKEHTFDLDFDLGDTRPPAAVSAKPEAPAPAAATGLDADLGAPAATPAKEASFDLDFDLGMAAPSAMAEAPTGGTMTETKSSAPTGDDFTIDLGEPMTSGAGAEAALDVAASAPTAGAGKQQQWDEAATKLDLARAYIDMGDADGARSILEEVMAEGNAEQKKQAQDLVAQIR